MLTVIKAVSLLGGLEYLCRRRET